MRYSYRLARLVIGTLFAFAPSVVFAQTTLSSSAPDIATLRTFDTAFHALSEQAQATILAEGRPLHLTLSDKEVDALKADLANSGANINTDPSANASTTDSVGKSNPAVSPTAFGVPDTIAKVAEAYDYTAEKVNAHLYLLHKRYSDVHDLPCVTYEELRNAIRQLELLCDQYGGSSVATKGEYAPAELLFLSLTPEQIKKSETGIGIGELTADQQQMARTAAVEAEEVGVRMNTVVYSVRFLGHPRYVFTMQARYHQV